MGGGGWHGDGRQSDHGAHKEGEKGIRKMGRLRGAEMDVGEEKEWGGRTGGGGRAAMGLHKGGGKGDKEGLGAARGAEVMQGEKGNRRWGGGGCGWEARQGAE